MVVHAASTQPLASGEGDGPDLSGPDAGPEIAKTNRWTKPLRGSRCDPPALGVPEAGGVLSGPEDPLFETAIPANRLKERYLIGLADGRTPGPVAS